MPGSSISALLKIELTLLVSTHHNLTLAQGTAGITEIPYIFLPSSSMHTCFMHTYTYSQHSEINLIHFRATLASSHREPEGPGPTAYTLCAQGHRPHTHTHSSATIPSPRTTSHSYLCCNPICNCLKQLENRLTSTPSPENLTFF